MLQKSSLGDAQAGSDLTQLISVSRFTVGLKCVLPTLVRAPRGLVRHDTVDFSFSRCSYRYSISVIISPLSWRSVCDLLFSPTTSSIFSVILSSSLISSAIKMLCDRMRKDVRKGCYMIFNLHMSVCFHLFDVRRNPQIKNFTPMRGKWKERRRRPIRFFALLPVQK